MTKEPKRPNPKRGKKPRPTPSQLAPDPFSGREREKLAAIVEGSDDAILTKDLNGIITSWNKGAQRLFGYVAEEVVGKPVTILIPLERRDEEPGILARIRRGERVDHYETVRQRKDGSRMHISLTVSPLRDETGTVIGASKIARDISDRHRAQEQQRLLTREMQHRVKNAFALAMSLIRLCARRADSAADLADMVSQRLAALAQANALTVPNPDGGDQSGSRPTTLHALIRVLVSPFVGGDEGRFALSGDDVAVGPQSATPLALVLNELLTNATKHGALRLDTGRIAVKSERSGDHLSITWVESGSPGAGPGQSGFGTRLSEITIETQLGGTIERKWTKNGLAVTLNIDPSRL